jgi:hypothetical protein
MIAESQTPVFVAHVARLDRRLRLTGQPVIGELQLLIVLAVLLPHVGAEEHIHESLVVDAETVGL